MQDLLFWSSLFGNLLLAVNTVLMLFLLKKYPPFFQWFAAFLATGLVIQILARIYWYNSWNNLPLLHLYTLLEFLFLSLFYRGVFRALQLKYFSHFILLGALFLIANSLYLQSVNSFNNIGKTFTQIAYISYGVIYLFRFSSSGNKLLNVINSAVLIYYSGSLFIFMFTNYWVDLKNFEPFNKYLWVFNILLDIVFQFTVLYALWTAGWRQTKSSP